MAEYLLFFLLPPAVYFGWWLAKTVERRSIKKRSRLFSNQYFQGLNYLLNEQPDKAIQVFLELAEVNQDTVETNGPRLCWNWARTICALVCWTAPSACFLN